MSDILTLSSLRTVTRHIDGIELEQGWVEISSDLTLRWSQLKVDSGRPTILFIHGTGNDRLYPQELFFNEMLRAGVNILTIDLPGHGRESTGVLNEKNLWDFLKPATDHLCCLLKISKIHLVGQSLGSLVSARFSATYPKSLASLTLVSFPSKLSINPVSSATELGSLILPSFRDYLKLKNAKDFLPAIGNFKRKSFPIRLDLSLKTRKQASSYIHEIKKIIEKEDTESLLKKISVPTLVIAGKYDFLTPLSLDKEYVENAKHVRVHSVDETHFTTLFSLEVANMVADHVKKNH